MVVPLEMSVTLGGPMTADEGREDGAQTDVSEDVTL